jgi:tetratricopeptide (TPR) repeat protein
VALFFALGLMSKPTLVPLPFLLWLLDYWPLERFQGSERRRVIVEKLPLLALSGAFCVLLAHIQSGVAADATLLSFPWRVANSIRSWAVYVGQTVWPSGLIPIYLHALKSTSLWQVGLAALALLGATGVIAYSARRRPFLAVGWLWFLGMLVPVIGWVQVGIQAHADRYTYLPQTGLFLMLVWMIPARLAERRAGRIALGASAAALLLALSAAAYRQAGFWQNSERLWSRTLAQAPENYVALSNLALVLQEQGRFDEALELLYRARSVAPDRAEIYCNIGDLLARKGRLEEALPHLREAVAIRPQLAQAQYNLGNVLMKLARLDEALVPLQRAVAEDPGMVGAYVDLGSLWIRKGLPEQAIVYLEAALRLQPNFAEVHNNLGIVYLRTGRFELAEACFEQALKVNPGMVEAYKNKGDLRLCLRSYRAAIHCFERALEIRPGFSAAMPGLMMARSALAEQSRARQACYRAIEAEPDSVTVRMRAGGVLASQGLYQEAVEQFEAVLRLDPEHRDACNNLAWILATCPEASVRDGERAVRLARDAMARSPAGTVATLDTLAAALAATGKFSEAAATLRSALESPEVQSAAAARLRARLALYEAARPYVDSVQE